MRNPEHSRNVSAYWGALLGLGVFASLELFKTLIQIPIKDLKNWEIICDQGDSSQLVNQFGIIVVPDEAKATLTRGEEGEDWLFVEDGVLNSAGEPMARITAVKGGNFPQRTQVIDIGYRSVNNFSDEIRASYQRPK